MTSSTELSIASHNRNPHRQFVRNIIHQQPTALLCHIGSPTWSLPARPSLVGLSSPTHKSDEVPPVVFIYRHENYFDMACPNSPQYYDLRREEVSRNYQTNTSTITPQLLPGIKCPTCKQSGKEVWVLPGKECGYCGTPCG
ncbi:hypothetical protein SODALDRAFT_201187 [Sodiomyces alkalinus F11]|uniref:Uncharacterized protein n=1 Tax=Sodiomyces alkalinus (strain CBS 110278 / VKM F-3762 / F11) TaxID=1314773 RepID=A0A3N2PTH0_SODAK|nr:hypothetical protein SODALDRAFT_201187 [Sodiomyces alkalinus F11]ROT37616.1 hypothetical protein SODALDRAFT_201187 [Sodiomyces alkalinus F11]